MHTSNVLIPACLQPWCKICDSTWILSLTYQRLRFFMEASCATFQPRSCTGTYTQYLIHIQVVLSSWNTKCKYDCSKIPACSTHAQLVGPLTGAARVSQSNLKNLMVERSPNSTTRPSRRNPILSWNSTGHPWQSIGRLASFCHPSTPWKLTIAAQPSSPCNM